MLRPKTTAKFAEAVCAHAPTPLRTSVVTDDFTNFSRGFRKGGLDAARAGDAAMLSALATHGWDATTDRDKRGSSALHYAAGHGHIDCCAMLMRSLEVDDRASDGATPLHWAVAGVRSRRSSSEPNGFGTGGHLGAARWLV